MALTRLSTIAIAPRTQLHLLSQHAQAHRLFVSHQVQAHKLKLPAIALRKGMTTEVETNPHARVQERSHRAQVHVHQHGFDGGNKC
jgi:hypothetical protein